MQESLPEEGVMQTLIKERDAKNLRKMIEAWPFDDPGVQMR
jgi:hypothetical protein